MVRCGGRRRDGNRCNERTVGGGVFPVDKDEEFLRVKTDKSDLLFEIISEDTIKGEGFAEGLYIKKEAQ